MVLRIFHVKEYKSKVKDRNVFKLIKLSVKLLASIWVFNLLKTCMIFYLWILSIFLIKIMLFDLNMNLEIVSQYIKYDL